MKTVFFTKVSSLSLGSQDSVIGVSCEFCYIFQSKLFNVHQQASVRVIFNKETKLTSIDR